MIIFVCIRVVFPFRLIPIHLIPIRLIPIRLGLGLELGIGIRQNGIRQNGAEPNTESVWCDPSFKTANWTQTYWSNELHFSRSREVNDHVTIRTAIMPFPIDGLLKTEPLSLTLTVFEITVCNANTPKSTDRRICQHEDHFFYVCTQQWRHS